MRHTEPTQTRLSPDLLLAAYSLGIFPMAESASSRELFWFDPKRRGVLPLDDFHLPRRLRRTLRQCGAEIRVDHDFDAVIAGCAAPARGREGTWINSEIRRVYRALFDQGACHTVEVYQDGQLTGGLYGVSIGAAFFGESMFHRRTDASKIALAHLFVRLRKGGYSLLDTQFITEHLRQFGAREIPRSTYRRALKAAIEQTADFYCLPTVTSSEVCLQFVSQTS
ncbi:MAG: leucyl/phenylalanyl-tRNA--protein transferase [Flavobacteriaceae bacterium]